MTMMMTNQQQRQQQQQQQRQHHLVASVFFLAICLCTNSCHGFVGSFSPPLTRTKTKASSQWKVSTDDFVATTKNTNANAKHPPKRHSRPPPIDDQPLSKNQQALQKRKFPRTWVPLASVYELDPDRPTPLEFLDQKFVCYKQTSDSNDDISNDDISNMEEDDWIVLDDVCPHRLAPLSEGRIERNSTATTGIASTTTTTSTLSTIQCSYHGWEFDGRPTHGNGACVRIPQVSPQQEAVAVRSPKSRVVSYSCRVYKNILWFWPWPDVDSIEFALQHFPKGHPEGIMETIATGTAHPTTYTRDLPYGWDTLLENLIDPAHIPFAHHNLQGKRTDAIPIEMTVPESLGGWDAVDVDATNSSNQHHNQHKQQLNQHNQHNQQQHNGSIQPGTSSSTKRLGEAGFFFEWQDRTMGKHRGGIAEFKAPYGIGYEGFFYANKDDADAARGSHVAKKRRSVRGDDQTTNKDDDATTTEELRKFQLGVLSIPTKPGWSRAIIMAGGEAKPTKPKTKKKEKSTNAPPLESKSKPESTSEPAVEPAKPKPKPKKKSLVAVIFGLLPPWVLHLLSNRFLDSDLAFLHYQEQERLRHSASQSNNHGYYMPAQADRCIAALRQWLPLYTDYLASALPPPITDRTQLFDRYAQHTSHCKHCQTGMAIVGKARKLSKLGIVGGLVLSRVLRKKVVLSVLAQGFALACWGVLGLVGKIEPSFKVGEFKHYQNH